VANGTIPGVFAFLTRLLRFFAFRTIPVIIRAGFARRVMFVARRARPVMVATVILQQDIFAR
jgi:hypothetical protein